MRSRTSLIIDHEEEDQRFLTIAMVQVDAYVDCVAVPSGTAALEKLRNDPGFTPDYIFLNLNLPGRDARQTLVELRRIERLRQVPVIVMSATEDEEDVKEGLGLGATVFMVKPDTISKWIQLLSKILYSTSLGKNVILSPGLY
ncbi:response regulator [Telluribacter sp. SYSU D00476]|uniref:response regulator n=1 Tax=Telluribacter sp. SYSU D00476 TaxID=2811430 RepID=UPI001FF3365C|nr:response regulator [Telluribacter sp. SYSU D00476]